MLTKDDLYNQSTVPNIKNISLKLYKEFSEHVLMKKIFTYNFEDNTSIKVDFREWGIYHMLAVHHINYNIDKNKFFEEINNGLELSSFEETNSMNSRYKKYKKRITMFACVYYVLKHGEMHYLPTGKVPNTKNVKSDYILLCDIGSKGMNIGMLQVGDRFVPITILISGQSKRELYIEGSVSKTIKSINMTAK